MSIRFYIDAVSDLPHIYNHDVDEAEVEQVLANSDEDRPGKKESRIAVGRTEAGRIVRVIYVRDPQPDSVFVVTAYELGGKPPGRIPAAPEKETQMKKQNRFPKGWNAARVRAVLEHYESQTEEEAVAEDEAAFCSNDHAVVVVPKSLVRAVTKLISRKQTGARRESNRR